jgi:ERCC4-type nuclease
VILAMNKSLGFDNSSPSPKSSKSFSLSLPFRRSKEERDAEAQKMSLSKVKLKLELSFQDIETHDAERLRHKVRATREVKDLWMLRSDVHQLISHQFNQQEAAQRINALLPCFAGWLPKATLTPI